MGDVGAAETSTGAGMGMGQGMDAERGEDMPS